MSTGQYIHVSKSAGTIVTSNLYNNAHANQRNNDIPTSAGAQSDDLAQFQATIDPAPLNVPTPVVDVGSEIEQYRFVIKDIKAVLNGGTPVAQWYTPVTADATLIKAHGARVRRSTLQSISVKTPTAIVFNTVEYDTGAAPTGITPPASLLFWSVSQPTRFTAVVAGIYQITGFGQWGTIASSGLFALFIRVNGSKIITATEFAMSTSLAPFSNCSGQISLAQGDYVELIAFQTTSNAVDFSNADFGIELLNPTAFVPQPTIRVLTVSEGGTGTGTVAWTPTNTGSTSPENYVDGTVVTLTATPGALSAFTNWTGDVPIGHANDNPLTVTMDQDRTLTANFDLNQADAAVHPHAGESSGASYSTTNKFGTLAEATDGSITSNSTGNVTVRAPFAFTIESFYVQLTAALGVGKSVTFKINVNGSTSNAISVTVSGNNTTGFSTDGPLSIAQDDVICIEAATFGSTTSASVDHFALGIRSTL